MLWTRRADIVLRNGDRLSLERAIGSLGELKRGNSPVAHRSPRCRSTGPTRMLMMKRVNGRTCWARSKGA